VNDADRENLTNLWARWWSRLIFTDDPGPCGEWRERVAFDDAVRALGLDVDATADVISGWYQDKVWRPREAMFGGVHRRS
jgi:hypothetical protein